MQPKRLILYSEHRGEDMFRIVALSDALFAIVLTLLVLELKLPEMGATANNAVLLRQLIALWPRLFSFLLTFFVTGLYWVAHCWDFEHIARYDRHLLWLNLMFLLSVSLLPFTTALLGDHFQAASWILYAVNMISIGLTLTAVWGYAVASRLVEPALSPTLMRYVQLRHLITPSIFVLSIPVSFIAPTLASVLPITVPVLNWLLQRLYFGRRPSDLESEQASPMRALGWRLLGFLPLIGFVALSLWMALE